MTTTLISLLILAAGAPEAIEVTVYADRAEVTRTAQISCANGKVGTHVFEKLPAALDEKTLSGAAVAPAVVVSTIQEQVDEEPLKNAEAAKLEADIDDLDEKLAALEAKIASGQKRAHTLNRYADVYLGVLSEESRNRAPKPDTWAKTIDLLKSDRMKIAKSAQDFELEQLDLQLEKKRLRGRLERLGSLTVSKFRRARVSADCKGRESAKVSLTYVVPGATWRPEYDLRFSPPDRIELGVGAIVQQSTGEDWTKAKLTLSTAAPRLGAVAPYPAPIYFDGYEEKDVKKVLVESSVDRSQLRTAGGKDKLGAEKATPVAIEEQGQSFSLTVKGTMTVKADGRPVWMPVTKAKAKGRPALKAMPKLSPHVYEIVEVDNPAPFPLAAGRLRAYRGGAYLGEQHLDYHGAKEPIPFSLGMLDDLVVMRSFVEKKDRAPGLFSSTRRLVEVYEIELINQANKAVRVEVVEAIPVSQTEEVSVSILKETTGGYQFSKEQGFITWAVDLAKGKKKKLMLAYEVKVPDDWAFSSSLLR